MLGRDNPGDLEQMLLGHLALLLDLGIESRESDATMAAEVRARQDQARARPRPHERAAALLRANQTLRL